MTSLADFLKRRSSSKYPRSEWIEEPFLSIYVRSGPRFIDVENLDDVRLHLRFLTIANVNAEPMGQGHFTRFIENIEKKHHTYVECVGTPRFKKFFLNRGYLPHRNYPDSFYKLRWQPGDVVFGMGIDLKARQFRFREYMPDGVMDDLDCTIDVGGESFSYGLSTELGHSAEEVETAYAAGERIKHYYCL